MTLPTLSTTPPSLDPRITARRRFWITRGFCLGLATLFLCSRPALHDLNVLAADLVSLLGIILAAVGALGRLWCSSYIAGKKNTRLLMEGPYSLVRNPLYVFSYVGGLGIAITTETVTVPIVFTVWFFWFYSRVVDGEERFLTSLFGQQFDDYKQRVPRFVPYESTFIEPDLWELRPRSFRQSLKQVVWFVIAAVVLHAVHDLRLALGVPGLITLY